MNIENVIELLDKYGTCPQCGNNILNGNENSLIIEEDSFIRTCECGFKMALNANGEVIEKHFKG